jgi:hypothetical protein
MGVSSMYNNMVSRLSSRGRNISAFLRPACVHNVRMNTSYSVQVNGAAQQVRYKDK